MSCTEDDRLLTATCGPLPGRTILVRRPETRASTIAVLDTLQWLPGTILELRLAGAGNRGSARAAHLLRVSKSDFLPPEQEGWFGDIMHAPFDFDMDDDVRRALRITKSDLLQQISDHTAVIVFHAQRVALRSPLEMINHDPVAVDIIRGSGAGRRFALVSGVSYGTALGLEYDAYEIATNTIGVEGFYLHLRYDCATVTSITSKAEQSEGQSPFMFVYTPIRAESSSGKIIADNEAIDLSDIDFF